MKAYDLQFDGLSIEIDGANLEIDANRADVAVSVRVILKKGGGNASIIE